jgi:ABC-2 type transport system permease protein
MMSVWLAIAGGQPVGSFRPADFVSYYLGGILVRQMVGVWIVWDLERAIRLGELSPKLLRPINPIHEYATQNLAAKPLRLPILLPAIGLGVWLYPGAGYDLTPLNLLAFLTALALAWLLYFLIQYCIGLLAFWISQATALWSAWFHLWLVFSGYLIPLDLFPQSVIRLSSWLPFSYTFSFPLEVLMGRVHGQALMSGFGVQMAWVMLFFGLYQILWRRGLRRYSAVGA